jgi:threonine aldolase
MDEQHFIDLRSDTVTRPSPAMREAMARAEVGDDVFGEDPTVNLLQQKVAALLGKEAGLFVPSGTMGNQTCIKVHTQPGDEIILRRGGQLFCHRCRFIPSTVFMARSLRMTSRR